MPYVRAAAGPARPMRAPTGLARAALLLMCCYLATVTLTAASHAEPAPHDDDPANLTRQLDNIDLSRFEPGVGEALRLSLRQLATLRVNSATPQAAPLAAGYAQTGMLFHAHHLQDIAQACYEAALRIQPERAQADSAKWAYLLAYSYQESGDFEAALKSYRRSLELAPDYTTSRYRIANMLALLNRGKEAQSLLESIIADTPGHAAALALLGDIHLQAGEYQTALDYFQRALAGQPQARQLHYRLAQVYRGLGQIDKARAHIERHGKQAPRVDDAWLSEMQTLSRSSQYFLELGMRAARAGQTQAAVSIFEQAVSFNPGNEVAHVMLGKSLVRLGAADRALLEFNTAIELVPSFAAAWYNKARLMETQGKPGEARELYRHAIELDADYLEARVRYADLLMLAGDYPQAAEHYTAAIGQRPGNDYLLFQGALARLAAGDCGDALRDFDNLLRRRPDHGRAMHAYARTGASCASASARQKQRAWEYARRVFEAQPTRAHREALAMAEAAQGRFEQALTQQKAVLDALSERSGPDYEFARANLRAYQARRQATRAWPADAAIFHPQASP